MSNHRNADQTLAAAFAALGNPHRLALFQRLATCCPPGTSCAVDEAAKLCVAELGTGMEIAPSTLSHHLKTLRNAGLVHTERRGKQVACWVDPEMLRVLARFFLQPVQPAGCCPGEPHVQS